MVDNVTFAHISDTHLGVKQFNSDQREQDVYDSFNEAIDKIIDERVDFVIHSGDLFDHYKPPIKAMIIAKEGFTKLREHNISVYIVPGNHETPRRRGNLGPIDLYDGLVKFFSYRTQYFEQDGIFIGGVPYYPSVYVDILRDNLFILEKEASSYNKKVLVMHQGIKEYLPPEGSEISKSDIPETFNYYALGHLHKNREETYGEGLLAYAGSTELMSLSECLGYDCQNSVSNIKKGFYLVDTDGDLPSLQFVNVNTRKVINSSIDINRIDDLDDYLINLKKTITNNPIIWLKILHNACDTSRIYEKVSNYLEESSTYIKVDPFDVSIGGSPESVSLNADPFEIMKDLMIEKKYSLDDINFALDLIKHYAAEDEDGAISIAKKYFEEWSS